MVERSDGRREQYDGVLVANGHLCDPNMPTLAQDFEGLSLHSARYRNCAQLEGERVVVVGSGNSGCDLAVDAAQAGRQTSISIRAGHTFLPKAFFGRPRAEIKLDVPAPPRPAGAADPGAHRRHIPADDSLQGASAVGGDVLDDVGEQTVHALHGDGLAAVYRRLDASDPRGWDDLRSGCAAAWRLGPGTASGPGRPRLALAWPALTLRLARRGS